ncbi:MAG: T9SS type A sorting domain-containing protein [Ignavibacteria bacterium]|nr:T9SS type A sorting domain-containing protein [Ignavibacteria bacterium]
MKTIQQFKYALIALLFVVPSILAQPTLLTPLDGAVNVSRTPTLNWTDIGSTTYRVEVATDPGFGVGSLAYTNDGVIGTSHLVPLTLAAYTTYYWHVRESAPTTGTYSTTFTFRTVPSSVPAAPNLATATPAPAATDQLLDLTFDWADVPETDSYNFELSTDPLFGSFVSQQIGLTASTATVLGLSESTPYYWRVTAVNSLGSTTSSNSSFTTLSAPVLTSPANTISGVSIQTNFGWTAPTGATSYILDISTDNFATTLLSKPGLVTNSYTLDSTEILDNLTTYYWKVKANNTSYSSTSSFMTLPAAMPQPNTPIGNATVFTLTPILYWHLNQPIANIVYDVQYKISGDPAGFTQIATETALQTVTLPTLLPNTTYVWRVIAKRLTPTRVCSYSAEATFTTAFGGDPVASWPLGAQTVYTTTPTLYWYHNEPQLTNRYLVEVFDNPTFTGLPIFTDSTTSQNITTTTLNPGYYYWRVHATSTITGNISGWSSGSFLVYFINTPDVKLSWPIGGATVYTVQPDLHWYLDSAYTGITFYVEYSVGDSLTWVNAGNTANQYLTFPGYLSPGTTYYWHVRAYSPVTGFGAWTAAEGFIVDPLASGWPTVPVISWPTAGSTIYSFNHAMNWYLDGPTDGLVFDGDIATNAGFTNLVASWTGLTTLFYNATLPNAVASYYWRVRSRNPVTTLSSTYAETATPFTVNPIGTVAPTPILDYPVNGTIVWTNTQTLFWYTNNTPSGTNFQVQLSIYGNFSVLVASNAADTAAGYSATSFAIPVALQSGYTYYWRVRSRIGTGHDDWGAWVSTNFVTDPGFAAIQPRIGGPLGGVNVFSSDINLNWFVPAREQNQAKYEIQFGTNQDFSNATTVPDISAKDYQVSNLTKGTKYFWRVRAIGKDGSISGYSQPESFVPSQPTDVTPENVIPQTFELTQNYPNPFNPTTMIKYAIPQNAVVTLSIYNMLGQKIKTLVSEQKNAGTYSVQWNGDNEFGQKVSSGAYIYRINAGNFVKSMKLILMK